MQYLITTFDNGHVNWTKNAEILIKEASYIWSLYKTGVLKNIWFSENQDAILIIEIDEREMAKEIAENLPLVKENLIKYSIICLWPYTGLERIINGTDKQH